MDKNLTEHSPLLSEKGKRFQKFRATGAESKTCTP